MSTTVSPTTPLLQTPSFLFLGPPGSGKSTLAMQFPGVHFLDCDENLRGPDSFLRRPKVHATAPGMGLENLTYTMDRIRFGDDGKPLEINMMWERYVQCYDRAVFNPEVKTIVTDSLTGLDEMLLHDIVRTNGVGEVGKMKIQHWIPFRSKMKTLTMNMRRHGKINIVCCHQENKYKDQQIVHYDVTMSSKLADHFGWIFTDIFRFQPQPPTTIIPPPPATSPILVSAPPLLQCLASAMCDCKNSVGLPYEMLGTWENVKKYYSLT